MAATGTIKRDRTSGSGPEASGPVDLVYRSLGAVLFSPGWMKFWRATLGLFICAVIWEIVARYIVANPLFFCSLSDVFFRAIEMWSAGELQTHIWVSFVEFFWGFSAAIVVGVIGGALLAEWRGPREILDPVLSLLYAMPIIALGPIFILWMGIGVGSKIWIIFLTAVFPIIINTVAGFTNTDRTLVEVCRSFGAKRAAIYLKVRLPSAIPFIIAGLRLSVARALVGVVVAEFFGARAGLGFLIINAAQGFDTAGVFVGVLILSIAGVLSVELLKKLEDRLLPWQKHGLEN